MNRPPRNTVGVSCLGETAYGRIVAADRGEWRRAACRAYARLRGGGQWYVHTAIHVEPPMGRFAVQFAPEDDAGRPAPRLGVVCLVQVF